MLCQLLIFLKSNLQNVEKYYGKIIVLYDKLNAN